MKKISLINKNVVIDHIRKNNTAAVLFFVQTESEIHVLPEYESYLSRDSVLKILKRKKFNIESSGSASVSFFLEGGQEITYWYIAIDKKEKNIYQSICQFFGTALCFVQKNMIESLTVFFGDSFFVSSQKKNLAIHLQKTLILKLYQYADFFSDLKRISFCSFEVFFVVQDQEKKEIQGALEEGYIIGESTNFSRYLSDIPPHELYPHSFIELVQKEIKKQEIDIEVTVFDKALLVSLGMHGIVSVGKGSVRDPHLLVLKYVPKSSNNGKTLALVGKGITFDTGGISIKPAENMEDMKTDMSGAASVVASGIALAKLGSEYTIYVLTPLAENMVDGNSFRPGDIVRFYNGKTAEIKNTDAEGRIVLADALAYASKNIKPDIMIDLATLTGACSVALGPVYAGLMSEDDALINQVIEKGKETGDICWRLPLEDAYKPNMHSDFADMANIGTKGYRAGTTMGGMFLREFVDPTISWAHIDIANVASECPFKSYIPSYGATGFGVHLLVSLFKK